MKKRQTKINNDNPEWTMAEAHNAVGFEDMPKTLKAKIVRGRGPQKKPTKEAVTIRLSRDVVGTFRAGGAGWQKRIDAALKEWIEKHPAKST